MKELLGTLRLRGLRLLVLGAITLVPVVTLVVLPRIPQDPAYHLFADRRTMLAIPHALNVLSNIPFLFVGVAGLLFLLGRGWSAERRLFLDPKERWTYGIFFLGTALTSFGSAYYHWAPSNGRLLWDRLPMTLGFMSLLAAVIAERVSAKLGRRLLIPLIATGVASLIYWRQTELLGRGDLRVYGLVQFYPALAIPLLMLIFPPRYTRAPDLLVALGFYAMAKIFEVLDARIFALGHVVSGHTLKHLLAAFCVYWVLRMLEKRVPFGLKPSTA